MIHTAFNYHDPRVQIRAITLLALLILMGCMACIELAPTLRRRTKVALGILLAICLAVVVYGLVNVHGA